MTLYRADDWTGVFARLQHPRRKALVRSPRGQGPGGLGRGGLRNGEAQVVEFPKHSLNPGIYPLLDIPEGRRVDYVRMVAKTTSPRANLTLWLSR